MKPARILIAGSGYIGAALAALLRNRGHTVWTLRRTPAPHDPWALRGDLTRPDSLSLPDRLTHVLFCAGLQRAAPEDYEALFVRGLQGLLERLTGDGHDLRRFLFTSTTGLYDVTDGRWVDEDTAAHPKRETAKYYQQAELQTQSAPFPSVIARLSGLYGPGRTRLLRSVAEGTALRVPGAIRYVNHIHRDDAAAALAHLALLPTAQPLYLVTDNEPADRNELLCWVADRLGRPHPPFADETSMPLPRGGNKRCSNRRLRASGFACRYATYREGYAALKLGTQK